MKTLYHTHIFNSCYLRIIFVLLFVIWLSNCSELPSKSDAPDNPLDPSNPANKIQGPALVLSPTRMNINQGESFQLELWLVETDSVAGLSTRIDFDPAQLNLENLDSLTTDSESIFLQNGGQLIFFSSVDTDNGTITIDCAVVEGEPRNITGSGLVARLDFRHLTGTNDLNVQISENSLLRDDGNSDVQVADRFDSQITVK